MKINIRVVIGILLAAVAMFIAVNVLYGDSYKLLSGDVINNQQEMTQLAEALLKTEETALYDKYDITYDIEAKDGAVFFTVPDSGVGVYYISGGEALDESHQLICENWYYYEVQA